MKFKNLLFNRKKIASILLAAEICLTCAPGMAEIVSYNSNVTLKNGKEVHLYFTTGNTDNDYAYVSFDNLVGYISNRDINYQGYPTNSYYQEINENKLVLQDGYIYQIPVQNAPVMSAVMRGEYVHVIARSADGWCAIYNGNNLPGFIHESMFSEKVNQVLVAKFTGNNVNVRSSASTKGKNIIGFVDIADIFKILGKESDWYIIDYLGNTGYVHSKYVKETYINDEDLNVKKYVYLNSDTAFYEKPNGNILSFLPRYQDAAVIKEENGFYKVKVDGCIGYIDKKYANNLTNDFTIVDLPRQRVRTFQNYKEVYRAHMISGAANTPTEIGCFKLGHHMRDYQLTKDKKVKYWMRYNGNIGMHDASWQKSEYYRKVAEKAYESFAKGRGGITPYYHPSHGCNNLEEEDAAIIYSYVRVGDNVLVIGPNNLILDKVLIKGKDDLINILNYYASLNNNQNYSKIKKLF